MLNGSLLKTGSDPLGRYYTSEYVSELLVNSLKDSSPKLVLDLGAGAGSLSNAARKRWSDANILSVDIDQGVALNNLKEGHSKVKHKHHVADALGADLHKVLGVSVGEVDLSVCNPPYIGSHWKPEHIQILEDAGLTQYFKKSDTISADVLFMAQNLRMLRCGGQLGLIVPDGLITGIKYKKIRASLIQNHDIESCIELPRGAFKRTDAQAYILVINKNTQQSPIVKLKKIVSGSTIVLERNISPDQAEKRLDYSYWDNGLFTNQSNLYQIEKLEGSVTRGKRSSAEVKSLDDFIFHTTNFPGHGLVSPLYKKTGRSMTSNYDSDTDVIAAPGDILIARVGRNLENKVCIVERGEFAISDCVFRVRLPPAVSRGVVDFLRSDRGRFLLRSISSGVSAKYISKVALEELLFRGKLG